MTIDWITVSAQVVNFLILVWLLKRFLYRPVLRAMDRRERGIRQRLEEASRREVDAESLRRDCQQARTELEDRREALLEAARQEAEQTRLQLLDEARAEADGRREAWQRDLDARREAFLERLGQRSLTALEDLARQALQDLAGASLEAQALEAFHERLAELDAEQCRRLLRGEGPLCVTTAFALSAEQRERLAAALQRHLAPGLEIRFSRAPSLICGIELTRGGDRLGWSLADYLEALHERLGGEWGRARTDGEVG